MYDDMCALLLRDTALNGARADCRRVIVPGIVTCAGSTLLLLLWPVSSASQAGSGLLGLRSHCMRAEAWAGTLPCSLKLAVLRLYAAFIVGCCNLSPSVQSLADGWLVVVLEQPTPGSLFAICTLGALNASKKVCEGGSRWSFLRQGSTGVSASTPVALGRALG